MQPRIAVITMYYKSTNYGGVLQSYAMIKALEKIGYSAVQVSYERRVNNKNRSVIYSLLRKGYHFLRGMKLRLFNLPIQGSLNTKYKKFSSFRESIPHTDIVNDNNINDLNKVYDIFITGSDQVWHPNNFETAYSLKFVAMGKKRIAYSASIAHPYIPFEKQETYKKELQTYYSISVREELSVSIIEKLGFHAVRTLDPTLLLTRKDWERITPDSLFKSEYIFCYFFDDDIHKKELVERVGKLTKLPIVVLSCLDNTNRIKKNWNVDKQIVEASPQELLALIRDASYIFTDSYHVSNFSCLFEKDFFVFSRGEMGSRIETLLNDFNCTDRFIHDHEYSSFDIKTKRKLPSESSIQQLREDSFNFLKTSIGG